MLYRRADRSIVLRGLCDRVEARVGIPEGLFSRLRDLTLCIAEFHRLLRVGRRERVRLPAGGCDGFAEPAREVLGRDVQERCKYEEESEGGVEGSRGMGLLGAVVDK